jgi:hypothetical protein
MLDEIKIMQFADGTLDPSEKEKVKKQIDNNPEYKKILDDYIYTGELLNNLGNEIKSVPLPKYLDNKIIQFNKSTSKIKTESKLSFSFLNIFNIKYSAIAAAFCFVFMGGFLTNQFVFINQNSTSQITQQASKSHNLDFRSGSSSIDFYNSFNEKRFNEEINLIATKLKKNEKFEISISEREKVKFQHIDSFKDKNSNECKIIKSYKKIKITADGDENFFSLTICKNKNYWSLVAINIL